MGCGENNGDKREIEERKKGREWERRKFGKYGRLLENILGLVMRFLSRVKIEFEDIV